MSLELSGGFCPSVQRPVINLSLGLSGPCCGEGNGAIETVLVPGAPVGAGNNVTSSQITMTGDGFITIPDGHILLETIIFDPPVDTVFRMGNTAGADDLLVDTPVKTSQGLALVVNIYCKTARSFYFSGVPAGSIIMLFWRKTSNTPWPTLPGTNSTKSYVDFILTDFSTARLTVEKDDRGYLRIVLIPLATTGSEINYMDFGLIDGTVARLTVIKDENNFLRTLLTPV